MGAAVDRVLQKLHGVKPIANGWVARCPGHDDQHQSLQISERTDLSVGLHCHAGCDKSVLLNALGLNFGDLFATAGADKAKHIVGTYNYKSLDGTLLYQAVRFSPKEFRQRRPDTKGGWIWNLLTLKGKHVAYRLPELKGHNTVVVVEGEKDADRLWSLNIPATCNIGGASKWGTAETKSLVAAGVTRIVIFPDHDEAGEKHADVVAKSAKLANLAVSVVDLPGLPPHGDISDWLDSGHTKEDVLALVAGTPYIVPTAAPPVAAPDPPAAPPDVLDITTYHLTDLGVAESLRDRYGDYLRYDHQREQWLLWDGHFWKPDLDDGASRVAYEHVRKLQRDALLVPSFLERKKYLDFAMGREKRGPLVAMLQQSAALKPIAISGDQWDQHGMLLGCPNGIVDLTTGHLRDGTREDYITLQSGTPYSHAECPRWMQFLGEVFDNNTELIDWIWRAVGYSLTADMREQCFFVAYGSGSNGKSIFIDALETIFGTYGHRADMRMFAGFSTEMNAFQNADFRGKRLVFAAEVRANARMNEHILKHLTGGETLRAEHKYGRSFTIRPVGKIWLSVNHRPKVADDSFGFWRRVRMVPFLRTFAGSADDRSLRDTIRSEAPGILAWAVQGCLEWQARGLAAPQVVQEATDEYKQGEDALVEFFDARVLVDEGTVHSTVSLTKLYAAYREWTVQAGLTDRDRMSLKAFAAAMAARPFERHGSDFRGLELVSTTLQYDR